MIGSASAPAHSQNGSARRIASGGSGASRSSPGRCAASLQAFEGRCRQRASRRAVSFAPSVTLRTSSPAAPAAASKGRSAGARSAARPIDGDAVRRVHLGDAHRADVEPRPHRSDLPVDVPISCSDRSLTPSVRATSRHWVMGRPPGIRRWPAVRSPSTTRGFSVVAES
jgi:hypothetical protein